LITPELLALVDEKSALPLFVLLVLADDPHHAGAADHLALAADLLDGRTDFHVFPYLYL
jgi:hypothetical protein